MPSLLLFGPARREAGVRSVTLPGSTVDELIAAAAARFGPGFARICECSQVWVNEAEATGTTVVGPGDEVAVLPPVSGGAGTDAPARPWDRPAQQFAGAGTRK